MRIILEKKVYGFLEENKVEKSIDFERERKIL